MISEEVQNYLKIIKEDIWEDNGYGVATEEYENQVEALDAAIKAVEVVDKIKKAYAEYSPHKFAVAESIGAILCDAYGADEVNASGFARCKSCCDNCGTGLQYCELDNRDRFRFCGNWTPKGVVR